MWYACDDFNKKLTADTLTKRRQSQNLMCGMCRTQRNVCGMAPLGEVPDRQLWCEQEIRVASRNNVLGMMFRSSVLWLEIFLAQCSLLWRLKVQLFKKRDHNSTKSSTTTQEEFLVLFSDMSLISSWGLTSNNLKILIPLTVYLWQLRDPLRWYRFSLSCLLILNIYQQSC
jgi:hypothetical protein